MFDVRRLVVLQEIARSGSLSAAAAALSYTTSAVSQQVTALERDLGCRLLVRGPSGAQLTTAGTRLLEHVPAILGAIAAAEKDLAALTGSRGGKIRIASFSSAAAVILPPALARLRTVLPGLDIELIGVDPADGVALLRTGDADAAMVTEVPGERPEFPDVSTVGVYDDEFFVVLPHGHTLTERKEVPLAALAQESWVISSENGVCPDTRVFRTACRRAGFEPSVTFRADDYGTVQGLVAAGLGVSLVPSLAATGVRTGVALRRVAGHRPVRRVSIATASTPAPKSMLATVVGMIAAAGTQLAGTGVYSIPAHASSVA
ncbi:LysR family transcriptional regulator [Mycolicibacterium diernhoferi]|uniref:LysR family transcriptional regulator n=1 Tax=Mycolicibacterium diernhoferi TaxID=1801 RepID=A0A1Q4H5Q8_9MYCO|nr:LysR family transcriptional regulator [Mycolicibacterium diernhoferi]OJZ62886.1 LysR family transcriptional regulator [Mycolicibacterium diernhoferi]OPE53625.1 LysR family transcriptional regulator [Mycolicibacterium diernhoferi]PEG54704.1 LysR family transcriptional regulator [Mycolicibacterium diernhoferi]QYL22924.1 LysR family transcriptional regulator [Mycolicibacterium diernhoferi]